ncbi:fimbrial protein [Burkholderia cenocepacia]|uniref:fimbrial protein n=1 Tax=Burkholderia cenocepacia TaxID=95486 RepID=UPI001CF4BD3A|nr:fimbrial protein [Burkholderia cenocepacia]MCA8238378.1 fimbrial protein [Burkholderia cenocepacia]
MDLDLLQILAVKSGKRLCSFGRKRVMKIFAVCTFAVAAAIPASAFAECQVRQNSGQIVPFQRVEFPSFQPAVFDPEVPNGTVLYRANGTASGVGGVATCDGKIMGTRMYRGMDAYNSTYSTYATSVEGVGYRIAGGINTPQWWPQQDYYDGTAAPLADSAYFTIELVKTGPITSGGILTGQIGQTYFADQGYVARRLFLTGGLPIKPTVPTCTVRNKVIGVPLGSVSAKSLETGGGSDFKPFSIDLDCFGGTQGASTRMFITMTDAAIPGNRSGVLTLASSGSSAAAGVGVEIRRADDTIVRYGPDSSASANPNQWFVAQQGNGHVSIPLKARYLRTVGPMKGGTANATATFTMSYQ